MCCLGDGHIAFGWCGPRKGSGGSGTGLRRFRPIPAFEIMCFGVFRMALFRPLSGSCLFPFWPHLFESQSSRNA